MKEITQKMEKRENGTEWHRYRVDLCHFLTLETIVVIVSKTGNKESDKIERFYMPEKGNKIC